MAAVPYRLPGATLTEREHRVPLDHAHVDGPQMTAARIANRRPSPPTTPMTRSRIGTIESVYPTSRWVTKAVGLCA